MARDAAEAAGHDSVRLPAGPRDMVDGTAPSIVVAPRDAAGFAAALRWAQSAGLSVVARGRGTKDAWGRRPRPVDVLLSLARMDRVRAHAAADLTATVEAGARLSDVNHALRAQGQRLPLDPPHGSEATIGGILATNDTGPLRHRYGTPRDLVLGMTVATSHGELACSGGRVVKNVAGYDIARLMAGSHGSLAVILDATFKLVPVASTTRTLAAGLRRPADVVRVIDRLRDRQCEPEAFEMRVSQPAAASDGARATVLIRFASVAPAVDDGIDAARACADEAGATTTTVLEEDAEARAWADHRHAPRERADVVLRASWRPAALEDAAAALARATAGLRCEWTGRAVVGSGEIGLMGDHDDIPRAVDALRSSPAFDHVVIVESPAAVRERVDVWQTSTARAAIWRALKQACDPTDTLNAGRGPL